MALRDSKQRVGKIGLTAVLINTKPYFPGHLLIVPLEDRWNISPEVLETLYAIRKALPKSIYLFANIWWHAGQSLYHIHVHVIPDLETVRKEFAEPIETLPPNDHLNPKIAKAIAEPVERYSLKAIPVEYNFDQLCAILNQIAGVQRAILRPVDVPYLPSVHLEFADRIYIYPRGWNPPNMRLAILELFYRSRLARDLEGEAEQQFWKIAEEENKKILSFLRPLIS